MQPSCRPVRQKSDKKAQEVGKLLNVPKFLGANPRLNLSKVIDVDNVFYMSNYIICYTSVKIELV